MKLFFPMNNDQTLKGSVDAEYLSDLVDAKSQTSYVFLYGNISISWKST
jgi:hypothetical protein